MSVTVASAPCDFAFAGLCPEPAAFEPSAWDTVWDVEFLPDEELGLTLAADVSGYLHVNLITRVDEGAVMAHNAREPFKAIQPGDAVLTDRLADGVRVMRIARWTFVVDLHRPTPSAEIGLKVMGPPRHARLAVMQVMKGGLLAKHNADHPDLAVQVGDELLSASGAATFEPKPYTTRLRAMEHPQLLVLRVPSAFR